RSGQRADLGIPAANNSLILEHVATGAVAVPLAGAVRRRADGTMAAARSWLLLKITGDGDHQTLRQDVVADRLIDLFLGDLRDSLFVLRRELQGAAIEHRREQLAGEAAVVRPPHPLTLQVGFLCAGKLFF